LTVRPKKASAAALGNKYLLAATLNETPSHRLRERGVDKPTYRRANNGDTHLPSHSAIPKIIAADRPEITTDPPSPRFLMPTVMERAAWLNRSGNPP
jgi:hypothetical protein